MLQTIPGSTRPTKEIQEAFIKLYASLSKEDDIRLLKQVEDYLIERLNDQYTLDWKYNEPIPCTIDHIQFDPWRREEDYWLHSNVPTKDPGFSCHSYNNEGPPKPPKEPEVKVECQHWFRKVKGCGGCN